MWNAPMVISSSVFKQDSSEQSNQWSLTSEKGKMGSKPKVQSHSPGKIFKQKARETLIVMNVLQCFVKYGILFARVFVLQKTVLEERLYQTL